MSVLEGHTVLKINTVIIKKIIHNLQFQVRDTVYVFLDVVCNKKSEFLFEENTNNVLEKAKRSSVTHLQSCVQLSELPQLILVQSGGQFFEHSSLQCYDACQQQEGCLRNDVQYTAHVAD